MRILIADDDKIPLSLLRFQLEQWGHSVLAAENGAQAWELFQSHDCQVVITDWEMPGLTGIELLRNIRAADRTGYVYVILLTSKSEQESVVTGLVTGADTYLTKPVNPGELQARLRPGQRIIDLEQRLSERQRELEDRNQQLSQANAKMKRNLDAAASIQQAFLPKRLTDIPDVRFAWHFSPCDELAGDMLNVLPLDQDHVGVYMLDVSGHGVQAALLAVSVCRSLSCHPDDSSVLWQRRDGSNEYELLPPAVAVRLLNTRMTTQSLSEQYFTLFYGILNRHTGEFRYTNAGHPSPVHISESGQTSPLPGDGMPVGIVETDYDEHRLQLAPGERLVFYSDGVTESMNLSDELFGTSRLFETLRDSADRPLGMALTEVVTQVAAWRGAAPIHDDLSLLTLEYAPQRSSLVGLTTSPAKETRSGSVTRLSADAGSRS
ncbi:MAG: SpoIIE family protein phosphatase [Planctomycetaceae bacterium]|nr:SpoIIE family protein phosphatase [Planctomycetaceae bacterium]